MNLKFGYEDDQEAPNSAAKVTKLVILPRINVDFGGHAGEALEVLGHGDTLVKNPLNSIQCLLAQI